jgi:hypothetical protein
VGLYPDWVKRAEVEGPEDDVEGDAGDVEVQDFAIGDTDHSRRSRSASSAVTFSSSSRPTASLLISDDDDEGGIADDPGERSEGMYLTGKAKHPDTLRRNGTGVSELCQTPRCDSHVNHSSPALSPRYRCPHSSNQVQVPRSPRHGPRRVISVLVISQFTFTAPSETCSRRSSMNYSGHLRPGSNPWKLTFKTSGSLYSLASDGPIITQPEVGLSISWCVNHLGFLTHFLTHGKSTSRSKTAFPIGGRSLASVH